MLRLSGLFHEIHRRGLWQAAAAYLGMGWAVLEVMDMFTGRGLLPDWTFTGTLVVLAIGLPVVMATAFVQTPKIGGEASGSDVSDTTGSTGPESALPETALPADTGPSIQDAAPIEDIEIPPVQSSRPTRSIRGFLTWKRAILGGVFAFALLGISVAAFGLMRVTGIGSPGTLLAQQIIQEAVALDTTFAEAYRYLSILVTNHGGSVQLGADAAARAFRHRGRLSPKKQLLVEANYHLRVTGDYPQAARAYRGLLELDSLDSVSATNLAQPDNVYLPGTRSMFFAVSGQPEKALAELDGAPAPPDEVAPWLAYVRAIAYAQAERLDLARESLYRAYELQKEFAPTGQILFVGSVSVLTGWMGGDAGGGKAALDALLEDLPLGGLDPIDRSYGSVGLLYAMIGAPGEVQEFVDLYRSEVPSDGDPSGRSYAAVAEAMVKLLNGATVEASDLEGATATIRCRRCQYLYLGQGYELTAETSKAIDAY